MFILHFNPFFEVFAGDRLEPPWHQAGRALGWSFCGSHRPFLASPALVDLQCVVMADEQPEPQPVKSEFGDPEIDVLCSSELISRV